MIEHGHHHEHATGRVLAAALLMTAGILAFEAVAAGISHSLALLADAGHLLTDVFALGLAWFAVAQSRRPADSRRTYGYHRVGILAALLNATVLPSGETAGRNSPAGLRVRLMAWSPADGSSGRKGIRKMSALPVRSLTNSSEPKGQELEYAARVSLDRVAMQVDEKLVKLGPGMAVTVEIKQSRRHGA